MGPDVLDRANNAPKNTTLISCLVMLRGLLRGSEKRPWRRSTVTQQPQAITIDFFPTLVLLRVNAYCPAIAWQETGSVIRKKR